MNLRSPTPRTLAALLILFTLVAYLPAIGAGYIWDDDTLLTANPQMRTLAGLSQIWHGENSRDYTPLTLTTFWLEWRLWGATPTGYHVVNILLHALSAILLWLVLRRLLIPGAWLAALLFAIHPVNVASVAWVAELKNTLSFALFLSSLLTYLIARDRKHLPIYFASILLFLLAALSKGAVVTLPAILLLCILWQNRSLTRRDILEIFTYAAIAVVAALLTIHYQARAQHYGLIPDTLNYRIARAGASIWYYLGALIWPAGLSPIRPPWLPDLHSPLTYIPAAAAVAAPVLFACNRRTWGLPFFFAYSCYLLMLLPILGFVWMTLMQETPGADWWQYMATPAIFASVAALLVTASSKSKLVTPLICIIIAILLIQTERRTAIYSDMETYCRAVTTEDPYAWTLKNNLGIMLKRQGRYSEAISSYKQALSDNPNYVEVHINLGNAYAASGNPTAAESEFRRAAVMRPGDPAILAAITNQAEALAAKGNFSAAEQSFRDALLLSPDSIVLRIELCQTLVAQGKKSDALQICDEVDSLTRKSNNPQAQSAAAKLRQDIESALRTTQGSNSQTHGWTQLRLVRHISQPFRLLFNAYDGDPAKPDSLSFQINTIDVRQPTQFVKIGDVIAGTKFKVLKFEFKRSFNTGNFHDVSELTLQNTGTGENVTLVIENIADCPDAYALFRYLWNNTEFAVKLGATFVLPPEADLKYKLIDITEAKALIVTPAGQTVSIPRLNP